jgi:VWFA-related protein
MAKVVSTGGRARIVRALPLLFLFESVLAAQPPLESGSTIISVNVNLVVLHASVHDRKGSFVSGLKAQNFRVFENGLPQTIKLVQHEDVPAAVGLVVDNSSSMRRKRDDVTAAALAFIRTSNPDDQMFVVNFSEDVSLGLPETEPFSASSSELVQALNGVPANGRTALYDAIETGLAHLKKATLDRKVLIVISDGGDNASHDTLNQVLDTAGRSNAVIYTVGLFDEYDEDRNPGVLRKIAAETGGEAFLPNNPSDLGKICERIAADIRNQYAIGYVPSDQKFTGHYRTIHVTATGLHGEKLEVRTRTRYLASPETGEQPANSEAKLK